MGIACAGQGIRVNGSYQGKTGGGVAGGGAEGHAGLLKPLLTAEAVGQIEDERNCKDSQDHGVDQHRHDVGGNKFHVQGGHGREDGDLQAEAAGHLDGL